jgi:hypothetical protein
MLLTTTGVDMGYCHSMIKYTVLALMLANPPTSANGYPTQMNVSAVLPTMATDAVAPIAKSETWTSPRSALNLITGSIVHTGNTKIVPASAVDVSPNIGSALGYGHQYEELELSAGYTVLPV